MLGFNFRAATHNALTGTTLDSVASWCPYQHIPTEREALVISDFTPYYI
jgi:hypothetical protein